MDPLTIALLALVAVLATLLAAGRRPDHGSPAEIDELVRGAAERHFGAALDSLAERNREAREAEAAAVRAQRAELAALTGGVREDLERVRGEVASLSRSRAAGDARVLEMLGQMREGVAGLSTETAALAKALRRPHVRGRWGETQLRRCFEVAGMTEHVDFALQVQVRGGEAPLRPDATVLLPGGGRIVVDAKVPLEAYLEAVEAEDESVRGAELARHASQLRRHVRTLASKRYQDQFRPGEAPDFTICFIPSEAAVHAAWEADPSVFEEGLAGGVLVATPTTLIALLHTVSLGWSQEAKAANAAAVGDAAEELIARVETFVDHLAGVGRGLASAGAAYDRAVGSLDARLRPKMREVAELTGTSRERRERPAGREPRWPERLDRPAEPPLALSSARAGEQPPGA